ncbi:MAG: hypothetical protein BWK77_02255 [Verrucomicrobia bacterium A1]|nr:MAG: hypothetical protein BWK77_02255 [Verrucomicrobia bacterium A1]
MAAALLLSAGAEEASIPVRVSFKFILDSNSNRPPFGALCTDEDVWAQVNRANRVFSQNQSEFRIDVLEIGEVTNAFWWYAPPCDDEWTTDILLEQATENPSLYRWRTDAVNVYINNGCRLASLPAPWNTIVLLGQVANETSFAHEIGHILDLRHTFEEDLCDDTIPDVGTSQNDIATNYFDKTYDSCSPAEQDQVNLVYSNLMSYHDGANRSLLSTCQMDRQSVQGYADRGWVLSKTPRYLRSNGTNTTTDGSPSQPYKTLKNALDAGANNNIVLVFQAGSYTSVQSSVTNFGGMVPRQGTARVSKQDIGVDYVIPSGVDRSQPVAVHEAVRRSQELYRAGDKEGAIRSLMEAEKHATGELKAALQHEVAKRLGYAGRYDEAASYYRKTAESTRQPGLKKEVLGRAKECDEKAAGPTNRP